MERLPASKTGQNTDSQQNEGESKPAWVPETVRRLLLLVFLALGTLLLFHSSRINILGDLLKLALCSSVINLIFTRPPSLKRLQIALTASLLMLTIVDMSYGLINLLHWNRAHKVRESLSGHPSYMFGGELGYEPTPGSSTRVSVRSASRTIFSAIHTIDDKGFRVTQGSKDGPALLFFGCSYMFGDTVEDDQTLPSRVSHERSQKVFNLGFSGWGPHQMLRILETRREASLLGEGRVGHAIYGALEDHVLRAAGRVSWDCYGPRYAIGENGEPEHQGPFFSKLTARALPFLGLFGLSEAVVGSGYYSRAPSQQELRLYAEIVARAAELIRGRYSAELSVLFWFDSGNEQSSIMIEELKKQQLTVWQMSKLIPRERWSSLRVRGDDHPNEECYRVLAEKISPLIR